MVCFERTKTNDMLTKDANLLFLENKIQEIKTAVFKAEIYNELKLPVNIITTLKTDGDGNIWFFTSCNGAYAKHIDKNFFAYLQYHQKDNGCRLRINGLGSIVEGESQINESEKGSATKINHSIILIKFKILHAEYAENKSTEKISMTNKMKTFLSYIFIQPLKKIYDFS